MMGFDLLWCSSFNHGTTWETLLSPCGIESAMSILFIIIWAPTMLLHIQSLRVQEAVPALNVSGMTGVEAGTFLGAVFLALLHLAHLTYSLISHPHLLFHLVYQSIGTALWLSISLLAWQASKTHTLLDNRPLFTVSSMIYAIGAYDYMSLYFSRKGFPDVYIKAELWTSVLQLAVLLILTVSEFKRKRAIEHPAGYAPLPDVESGPVKVKRTWVSLFVDACRYVWPESLYLKLRVLGALLLLISMRFLNIAVPIINKYMVNRLAVASEPGATYSFMYLCSPWVFAYLVVLFFQGGAGGGVVGFINNMRQFLWIPVSQDTYRRVSLAVFTHVLNLDLNFHLKRKTGEVTKVVDRGTAAIQNVLSTIVFSIGPQIFDVLIAATYLATALDPWIALIVFITIGSYIPLTVIVTEWRGSFRRDMNTTENAKSSRVTDALLNWETVKYFGNEPYEEQAYANSIDQYQRAEYRFTASLNVLNVIQSAVMFTGMSSGLLVSVWSVSKGEMTVGDVVLFLTLMAQLYAPLNFFGTYYRIIQQYMIDMENLFELLDRNSAIPDAPDAQPLQLTNGEVEFKDVVFSYEPNRDVLQGVSFKAPGGSTIAFVGATGSGKSTITRLLFRFYDTKRGQVLVDGQPVTRISQRSLRAAVGMVPQDCVLFNDTIRHNIRYGNLDASDEEVEAAAEAACIHEAITKRFPMGYNTVVGERGLRLSGGEKQRVAFARALLKNPSILVLDEATSALDSITEKKIQAALKSAREQRTTLIVAHRLSTIMDADCIVVMADGQVVETGTHQELLAKGGLYTELWSKQQSQQDDGASITPVGSSANLVGSSGP